MRARLIGALLVSAVAWWAFAPAASADLRNGDERQAEGSLLGDGSGATVSVGHGAHDDMSYVPAEMRATWEERDPILGYSARLLEEFGFAAEEVERIDGEVRAYVGECAERALASPLPEPALAREGVFADRWEPLGDGAAPWSGWAAAGADPTVERRAA